MIWIEVLTRRAPTWNRRKQAGKVCWFHCTRNERFHERPKGILKLPPLTIETNVFIFALRGWQEKRGLEENRLKVWRLCFERGSWSKLVQASNQLLKMGLEPA